MPAAIPHMPKILTSKTLLIVFAGVYVISFLLPAMGEFLGWHLFFVGLMYSFFPPAWPVTISWFANPLAWYLIISLRKSRFRRIAYYALIPVALEIQVLAIFSGKLLNCGYWAWVGSFILLILREKMITNRLRETYDFSSYRIYRHGDKLTR